MRYLLVEVSCFLQVLNCEPIDKRLRVAYQKRHDNTNGGSTGAQNRCNQKSLSGLEIGHTPQSCEERFRRCDEHDGERDNEVADSGLSRQRDLVPELSDGFHVYLSL